MKYWEKVRKEVFVQIDSWRFVRFLTLLILYIVGKVPFYKTF